MIIIESKSPVRRAFFITMTTKDTFIINSVSPVNTARHQAIIAQLSALIQNKTNIEIIFFYGDAILIAKEGCSQRQIQQHWVDFAEKYGIELAICSTGAIKRAIVNEEEAEINNYPVNLHPAFHFETLQLVAEAIASNQTIKEFSNHDQ